MSNNKSKVHKLKTWPEYYEQIYSGDKTFEVRKFDRDFKVGDVLQLYQWNPETESYTGAFCERDVTYILEGGQFGIQKGFCVMGIKESYSVTLVN